MSHDLIEKARGIQWPYREGMEGGKGEPRLYTDGVFQTDDGKANLIPLPFIDNNEKPCDDYPFWLRSVAGFPTKRYGKRSWAFWQYTATGSVPGVKGKVDRNAFAGSEKQWQNFLAQNIATGSINTAGSDAGSLRAMNSN